MKKAFILFACIAALTTGCNNSDNSNASGDNSEGIGTGPRSTDEDTAARNIHSVENANGNMPDTTNSINIGNDPKYNTADSAQR